MPVARTRRVVNQRAKGPVDPSLGTRVKALRQARGLTQAALAEPDFSKGFISLLETGRTRMSLRAAEIIANKLGVSASELISRAAAVDDRQVELTILRGEQHLTSGDPKIALEAADGVSGKATGALRVRAARLRGRALVELGRGAEAIPVLDEALRQFRLLGDTDMVVRTRFDLARAHLRADAATEAINLALDVERQIADGALVDRTLELQVLRFLGNALVTVGDLSSANARMSRAIQVAEDIGDPASLGTLYAGLAITREEQGDLDAALGYARRALAHFEQLEREREVAESWNAIGWLLTKRGHYSRAEDALERSASLADAAQYAQLRALVLVSQAELALGRGQLDEAIRLTDAATVHPGASKWASAQAAWVRAQSVAAKKAAVTKVRAAFEAALDSFEALPRRWRAKVHESYAQALAERGELREATAQFQKALDLTRPSIN